MLKLHNEPQHPQPIGGHGTDIVDTQSQPSQIIVENSGESTAIAEANQGGDIAGEEKCDGAHSENGSASRPKRTLNRR